MDAELAMACAFERELGSTLDDSTSDGTPITMEELVDALADIFAGMTAMGKRLEALEAKAGR